MDVNVYGAIFWLRKWIIFFQVRFIFGVHFIIKASANFNFTAFIIPPKPFTIPMHACTVYMCMCMCICSCNGIHSVLCCAVQLHSNRAIHTCVDLTDYRHHYDRHRNICNVLYSICGLILRICQSSSSGIMRADTVNAART